MVALCGDFNPKGSEALCGDFNPNGSECVVAVVAVGANWVARLFLLNAGVRVRVLRRWLWSLMIVPVGWAGVDVVGVEVVVAVGGAVSSVEVVLDSGGT